MQKLNPEANYKDNNNNDNNSIIYVLTSTASDQLDSARIQTAAAMKQLRTKTKSHRIIKGVCK